MGSLCCCTQWPWAALAADGEDTRDSGLEDRGHRPGPRAARRVRRRGRSVRGQVVVGESLEALGAIMGSKSENEPCRLSTFAYSSRRPTIGLRIRSPLSPRLELAGVGSGGLGFAATNDADGRSSSIDSLCG